MQLTLFKQNGLLLRNEYHGMIERINNLKEPLTEYVITGVRGVGKSALIAEIVNYYFETKEWIIFFIPNGKT
jgi:predicted AAA+ superfamily ATPase